MLLSSRALLILTYAKLVHVIIHHGRRASSAFVATGDMPAPSPLLSRSPRAPHIRFRASPSCVSKRSPDTWLVARCRYADDARVVIYSDTSRPRTSLEIGRGSYRQRALRAARSTLSGAHPGAARRLYLFARGGSKTFVRVRHVQGYCARVLMVWIAAIMLAWDEDLVKLNIKELI